MKRVMTRFDSRCVNLFEEFRAARPNVSYRLKVNEFTDFDNQRVYVLVHRAISPTMCGVA